MSLMTMHIRRPPALRCIPTTFGDIEVSVHASYMFMAAFHAVMLKFGMLLLLLCRIVQQCISLISN